MSTPESPAPVQPAQPTATADAARNRWREVWSFLFGLVLEVAHQPLSMLAKQAAYSLLYAIPSILIVLVALTALVDDWTDAKTSEALQDFIDERVPAELQPLFKSLVQSAITETSQSTAAVTALVSLGVAIWGGSGGVGALIYACNLVYDVRDTRPWWRRQLLKLVFMVVGGIGIVVAFVLFAFGQRIGEWIAEKTDRASVLVGMLSSGRGLSLVLVAISLFALYVKAPDVETSFRWLLPGTVAATLAIAITFAALDFVLGIWSPGSAYGAASSVLILLWTLWLMSAIVVAGAAINAFVGRRFDEKLARYLVAHPERLLRASAAPE